VGGPSVKKKIPPRLPKKHGGREKSSVSRAKGGISLDSQLKAMAYASATKPKQVTYAEMLQRAKPPKGVVPKDAPKLAMDNAAGYSGWASNAAYGMSFTEGSAFLGYPRLSEMAQTAEYRLISDVIADEASRKWIVIKSKSDDKGKADEIQELEDELKRLDARAVFTLASWQDSTFGRAHIYIDTGDGDKPDELKTNLGDGGKISETKLEKGSLLALRNIEPVWAYPMQYNANNPLAPDWYKPEQWYVMSKQLHVSRLLTFTSRPVPDLFKPAFSFGGLSLIQMAMPYVDNWLATRQSVNDLIRAFSTMVLKTDLSAILNSTGLDDSLYARLDIYNQMRDNRGTFILDKNNEEFANVAAPLGSLDKLQAQAQEHMSAVSRIPLVKLTGITPSGLNASSEGELRAFYDTIHGYQERFFGPHLETVFKLAQLNIWGKVDPDLTIEFLPLYELDEEKRSTVEKNKADTDKTLVDAGILDPTEARTRIANDPANGYGDIDPDDVPEPMMPEPGEIHEAIKTDDPPSDKE